MSPRLMNQTLQADSSPGLLGTAGQRFPVSYQTNLADIMCSPANKKPNGAVNRNVDDKWYRNVDKVGSIIKMA